MAAAADFLLALEGGGTRCEAALFDGAGQLLRTHAAGPVNTNFVTVEAAHAAVQAAVQGVLAAAHVPAEAVRHCAVTLVAAGFESETFTALCPNASYHPYGELRVVFARAGRYAPHGVGLVAGTGATAWGVRADDGREVVLGGWGSLLGDEGSAYALGLAGLRAAVRAFEGRAPEPTALAEAVGAHFGLTPETFRDGLIALAYHPPLSRTAVAQVAPVVTTLAAAGDPLARRLTAKVAADLADLARHTARRLFAPAEPFDVVVAGGLVSAGPLLLDPVAAALQSEFPNVTFLAGTQAPAVALGRLALHDLAGESHADPNLL